MPLNLNHFLKEFEIIVGTNNCISDQSKIKDYLEDWRGQIRGSPPLILFPNALDEVQKITNNQSYNIFSNHINQKLEM